MKQFTLFWTFNKSEVVEGSSIENAFSRAGYGAGAVRALDFFAEGDVRHKYVWNPNTHQWDSK